MDSISAARIAAQATEGSHDFIVLGRLGSFVVSIWLGLEPELKNKRIDEHTLRGWLKGKPITISNLSMLPDICWDLGGSSLTENLIPKTILK